MIVDPGPADGGQLIGSSSPAFELKIQNEIYTLLEINR